MKKLEKRSEMLNIQICFLKVLLIFAIGLTMISIPSGLLAEEKTQIIFRTPFEPSGAYAMFYSCQDRFWPEEGVSGEVQDGKGSADAVKAVAAGSANIGYAQITAIMPGIQEGMPIKIILMGTPNDASAIIALKGKGIKSLKDLEGKTVGVFPFGTTGTLAKAMLKRNNIDLSSIKFTNVPPGNAPPLLMVGKIDAMIGMAAHQDVQIESQGYETIVFPIKDYGVSIYEFAIIINTNWAKEVSRDTLLKYTRGIVKGFILSKTDTKKLIDDMIKYRPQQRTFYDLHLGLAYPRWIYKYKNELVDKHGFGWIDKSRMESTQNILFDEGILKKKTDIEKYYTMEYITDISVQHLAMEYVKAKLDPNMKAYYDKLVQKK